MWRKIRTPCTSIPTRRTNPDVQPDGLQPPGASCDPTFGVSGSGWRCSEEPSGSFIGVGVPGTGEFARSLLGCSVRFSSMTELLGAKQACKKTERVAASDPSILRRGNHRKDYPEATTPVCPSGNTAPVERTVSVRRIPLTRARTMPGRQEHHPFIKRLYGFLGINDLRLRRPWPPTMPAAPRWCGHTSLIARPQYFGPLVIHTPPGNAVQR